MRILFSSLLLLLLCKITVAQTGSMPQIGSDADIKEKLTTIVNALPDLVKAFGANGQSSGDITQYQAQLSIGKAVITLQQYNVDQAQEMDIDFRRLNYAGTKDDFKKFFDDLVNDAAGILGKSFYTNGPTVNTALDDQESVFFYENGKTFDSPVQVDFFYTPKYRDVSITFKIKKKET